LEALEAKFGAADAETEIERLERAIAAVKAEYSELVAART
jgi:archaellum component FlaC